MDLTKDQFKTIQELLRLWSSDDRYELETTFGPKGVVDSNTFLQIAQRLRTKGFETMPQDDHLNIITPNGMRFSLQGLGIVEEYCKDNMLRGKRFTAMKKENVELTALATTSTVKNPLDINEYDIRFKLKHEQNLDNNSPVIKKIVDAWATQSKAFRMIRRWSFRKNGIQVDMSMVRQSAVDDKGKYVWTRSFLDAHLAQKLVRYEVEVELLHGNEYTETSESALRSLIAGVGEVQRAVQKNSLLIRKSVANQVRTQYSALLYGKPEDMPKFRGVGPVTFQLKNMFTEIDPDVPNIRTGYNVTDKADGNRAMGFVTPDGELYLIDQSMNVYRTGLKNDKCKNSLVDGEWITQLHDGGAVNDYLIFDVYVYNTKKVSSLPFMAMSQDGQLDPDGESRYNALVSFYGNWMDGTEQLVSGLTEASKLNVQRKEFQFASASDIFSKCANILNNDRVYNTDGLIITSNTEPIPNAAGVRFSQQFKWKPSKDNTVDFLVYFEQNDDGTDKITTSIHSVTGESIQYKTMRLYVGGTRNKAFDNPRDTILFQRSLDDKDAKKYKPIIFQPYEYSDAYASYCYGLLHQDVDTFESYITTEHTHEPIQHNSIVEMRYDPSREPGWRWIPTRIRHDKTERLLREQAKRSNEYGGMMNNEFVAKDIWNSIHDPVTESMIRTGEQFPNQAELKVMNGSTDMTKKYYDKRAPKENFMIIKGLQGFHNKRIKNEILLGGTIKRNNTVVDIACGKGGDLFKWKFANAGFVMGIDIAEDNIINPNDGAYKRYLEIKEKFGNRPPHVAFAIGDSSKPLVSGEAAATPLDRDIMRTVFGKVGAEGPVPPYISTVMKDKFRDGADVVACMFAIHYFFKNSTTLDGLLKNLADTVKVGGCFVGCCFDGKTVFDMLQGTQTEHCVVGKENDIPIWKICKKYNAESIDTEDSSIGLAIDVEFLSIGNSYTEYLVPFDMLIQKLKTIGLELERSEMFKTTYETDKQNEKKFTMSPSVKDFSFLNRWFIFRRVHQRRQIIREELPPLPSTLDPATYTVGFDDETTGHDRTGMYKKFITVRSSDYSVLKPWHKEKVKEVLEEWFPNKEDINTIVDATAHIGVDTLYMAKLFPRAIIHSFEVVPETFVALRKNLEMFDPQGQIVPHNQDSTTWEPTEVVDFLFVDPPWGADYRKPKKTGKSAEIELYLEKEKTAAEKKVTPHDESKNIKQLITKWLGSGLIRNIVLKTPPNFNKNGIPPHKDVHVLNRGGKDTAYCLLLFTADRGSKLAAPEVLEEKDGDAPVINPLMDQEAIAIAAPVATAASKKSVRKPTKQSAPTFVFKVGRLRGVQPGGDTVLDTMNIDRWLRLKTGPVAMDELPTNAAFWLGGSAVFVLPEIDFTPKPYNDYKDMDAYMKMINEYLVKVGASKAKAYPTIELYLMAMRIKFTSTKPSDYTRGSIQGSIHKKVAKELADATPFSQVQFNLMDDQSNEVKKYIAKLIGPGSPLQFDNQLWNDIRGTFITFAIRYRLQHDVIFRNIIQSLKDAAYTIEYTESANNSHLESGKVKSGIANAIIVASGLGDVEASEKALQPPRAIIPTASIAGPSVAGPSIAGPETSVADAPKEVPIFKGEPITSVPAPTVSEATTSEATTTIPPISLFEEEPSDE